MRNLCPPHIPPMTSLHVKHRFPDLGIRTFLFEWIMVMCEQNMKTDDYSVAEES